MRNVNALKIACLLLFLLCGWRIADGLGEPLPDPSGELDDLKVMRARVTMIGSHRDDGPVGADSESKPADELRPEVRRVVDSALFGVAPPPPPPAPPSGPKKPELPKLQGIGAEFAILEIPGKGVHMIRAGTEKEGVKVVAIAINRVLIEVDGEKKELTIHSGFGSDPLLKPEEDQ